MFNVPLELCSLGLSKNVLNCNLYFAIIGFLPPIFILFTFQFSLFTLFKIEILCKYRNFFVTLRSKTRKSAFQALIF